MKGFNIPLIVKKIRQSLAIVENGSTASRNIAVGKYVLWKGDLYTVKTAITSGDTLSSTNLDSVSDGGLNSLSSNTAKYFPVTPTGTELWQGQGNITKTITQDGWYALYMGADDADGSIEINGVTIISGTKKTRYNTLLPLKAETVITFTGTLRFFRLIKIT